MMIFLYLALLMQTRPVVTKVWYEHYLLDGQLTLICGKIDAPSYLDTNEYANDETTQFISNIFKYSPAIDMPDDNGMGLRCGVSSKALNFIDLQLLWMEEDANW